MTMTMMTTAARAIDASNIASHELVGLHATVVRSANPGTEGLQGTVIDETRSMIIMRCANTEKGGRGAIKSVAKSTSTWRFALCGGADTLVDGSRIAGRPFERITAAAAAAPPAVAAVAAGKGRPRGGSGRP